MTDNEKLKPCPFCGGKAAFNKTVFKDVGYIQCGSCGVHYQHLRQEKSAIEQWNRRAPESQPALDWNKLQELIQKVDIGDYECCMYEADAKNIIAFLKQRQSEWIKEQK